MTERVTMPSSVSPVLPHTENDFNSAAQQSSFAPNGASYKGVAVTQLPGGE